MKPLNTVLLTLALTTTHALAQLSPPPPMCDAPPPGASKELVDCYDAACDIYQAAWAACQTAHCRQDARDNYYIALDQCEPVLVPPIMPSDRSSWVTLVYLNGQWSYRFDRMTPTGAIVFQF